MAAQREQRCEPGVVSTPAGGQAPRLAGGSGGGGGWAAGMLVLRCTMLWICPTARACSMLRRLPASPAALHNIGSSCRQFQGACSAAVASRSNRTHLAACQQRLGDVGGRTDSL